ncbi:hypothetical protein [uncultured Propionibacterium sp.]|uniref:hypothetical protein n=1 Tax=uncultured Propionibacterium sp. TaxID=218066 RepID=UPI00292CDEB6|nr:hypothetical protein [uncultured Propionibacterium sp.]
MTDSTVSAHRHRLAEFTGRSYDKGRGRLMCAVWALVADPIQRSVLVPPWLRARLLRAFGARIGRGTLIRHGVRVHWPWKLTVGRDCWVGVGAYLLNLDRITIGDDVCISQQAMLCTASHDADDPHFEIELGPVVVGSGSWIAARATVLRGVTIGEDVVVGATALVVGDVPDHTRVLAPRPEERAR